ncbi:MAG: hypothetical protein GWO00_20830, partial [Gemmatimonadetes bacterium]|nr:hypothetical protein [Actinomycetota bacterium]NIR80710.1 hypothetical protein [Gemmatimonadota bacterium]NIT89514.1 hypothetical protein [Gemmatimonadota bacterium]NIU33308.1 hypothetical protein [Gemmatimonadota bacterium]NIV63643.1 hypothetical protein [Gemmatimonadota bacterium]
MDARGAFHLPDRPPGPVELRVRANGRQVQGDLRLRDAASGSLGVRGGALLGAAGEQTVTAAPPTASDDGTGAADPATRAPPDAAVRAPADSTILGFFSDSVDVEVEADAFALRWAEAFLTPEQLASLDGSMDGRLTLTGSTSSPELGGELRVRDGSAYPSSLGVRWDAV